MRLFTSNFRLALRALRRSPVRTFLVLQGIAWAVGIAIFPSAVLEGSRDAAIRNAEVLGTGRISIAREPGGRELDGADVERLASGLQGWAKFKVEGFAILPVTLSLSNGAKVEADVAGAGPFGARVRDQKVESGRYLESSDSVAGASPVAVLEPRIAADLFGDSDPLGRMVAISLDGNGDTEFTVVGVLAPRPEEALNTDDMGLEIDHSLRPLAQRMLTSIGVVASNDQWKRSERCIHLPRRHLAREGDGVDWIIVRGKPQEMPGLTDAVRAALVERGAMPVVYSNILWPYIASEHIEEYMRLKDALALAVLVMGGVVIANVMLLTLLERTAEIALRRAEGATKRDIMIQFLSEAGVLGLAGAALGIPLGMLLAWGRVSLEPHRSLDFTFPVETTLHACTVAIVVAVLAGILPARRAAALDPAEALRAL